jgi:hypothetical protein
MKEALVMIMFFLASCSSNQEIRRGMENTDPTKKDAQGDLHAEMDKQFLIQFGCDIQDYPLSAPELSQMHEYLAQKEIIKAAFSMAVLKEIANNPNARNRFAQQNRVKVQVFSNFMPEASKETGVFFTTMRTLTQKERAAELNKAVPSMDSVRKALQNEQEVRTMEESFVKSLDSIVFASKTMSKAMELNNAALSTLVSIAAPEMHAQLYSRAKAESNLSKKKDSPRKHKKKLKLAKQQLRCGGCSQLRQEDALKKCGRCIAVYYCSKKCQETDWKAGNKKTCSLSEGCNGAGRVCENGLKKTGICHLEGCAFAALLREECATLYAAIKCSLFTKLMQVNHSQKNAEESKK